MFDDVGIYRNEKGMKSAIEKIKEWQERFKHVRIMDTGKIFNTELFNAWELGNMLEISEVIAECALNRTEFARRTSRVKIFRTATMSTGSSIRWL